MNNISEKIIALRKSHNLTQEALGEAVGVSGQAVSKWEKGDSLPDISIIPDLCKVFNITADTLLGNEGSVSAGQYLERALSAYKSHFKTDFLRDAFEKITSPDAVNNLQFPRLDTCISINEYVIISDGRGFGAYIGNKEHIKRICDFDYSESALLNLISDKKVLKIFTSICSSDGITQTDIIKITNFDENEVENVLFKLMKMNVIQTAMYKNEIDLRFIIGEHGSLLLTAMAAIALNDTTYRNKFKGIGVGFNNPNF